MGLDDLVEKHGDKGLSKKGWFSLSVGCEDCIFDIDDPKHCLIYLAENGKEKPSSSCKHKKTGKEAVEIAKGGRAAKE